MNTDLHNYIGNYFTINADGQHLRGRWQRHEKLGRATKHQTGWALFQTKL